VQRGTPFGALPEGLGRTVQNPHGRCRARDALQAWGLRRVRRALGPNGEAPRACRNCPPHGEAHRSMAKRTTLYAEAHHSLCRSAPLHAEAHRGMPKHSPRAKRPGHAKNSRPLQRRPAQAKALSPRQAKAPRHKQRLPARAEERSAHAKRPCHAEEPHAVQSRSSPCMPAPPPMPKRPIPCEAPHGVQSRSSPCMPAPPPMPKRPCHAKRPTAGRSLDPRPKRPRHSEELPAPCQNARAMRSASCHAKQNASLHAEASPACRRSPTVRKTPLRARGGGDRSPPPPYR
jgi:hypothetical protein